MKKIENSGERNNTLKIYYENGKLEREENYKDGKKHGKFKEYCNNGELKTEQTWVNDNLVITTYHSTI